MAYRVTINNARLTLKVNRLANRNAKQIMDETFDGAVALVLGGPYSTGALARHMYKVGPISAGLTTTGVVGNSSPIARIVHDGSGLHGPQHMAYDIFPKAATHVYRFGNRRKPMLRFFWRRAGRVVYMSQIPGSPSTIGRSHPGQRGKMFLARAAEAAARRHGTRLKGDV